MAERINAREARQRLQDQDAMLVCAYEDEEKCRKTGISEAVTLQEFRSRLGSIPKSRDLIFYCA